MADQQETVSSRLQEENFKHVQSDELEVSIRGVQVDSMWAKPLPSVHSRQAPELDVLDPGIACS